MIRQEFVLTPLARITGGGYCLDKSKSAITKTIIAETAKKVDELVDIQARECFPESTAVEISWDMYPRKFRIIMNDGKFFGKDVKR